MNNRKIVWIFLRVKEPLPRIGTPYRIASRSMQMEKDHIAR